MILSQKHVNNDFFLESLTQTCFKSYSHPKGNEKNGFCSFPSDKISIFLGQLSARIFFAVIKKPSEHQKLTFKFCKTLWMHVHLLLSEFN